MNIQERINEIAQIARNLKRDYPQAVHISFEINDVPYDELEAFVEKYNETANKYLKKQITYSSNRASIGLYSQEIGEGADRVALTLTSVPVVVETTVTVKEIPLDTVTSE
jgi:hypothetical protein